MAQVTLHKGGSKEVTLDISRVEIPNLWDIAMGLIDAGRTEESDMVLECWHIAHNLKLHIEGGT